MELLEKAMEYQKAVNMAMSDYETAKKAFDDTKNMEWNVEVKASGNKVDETEYKYYIETFMKDTIKNIVSTRESVLKSAEMRLAVLIGDKETVKASCDNAGEPQRHGKEKEDKLPFEMENSVKIENTASEQQEEHGKDNENWHTKANLYELYINEGVKVKDIALLYGVATPTVYGYLKDYGLTDLKKTMEKDTKYCGKCP